MEIKQQLIEGAKALNVQLTDKQADQLMQYKELLIEWNEKMNLTAITEDFEVITKHFLDCLTVQSSIDLAQVKTLV
ncbi:MAG: RsmG family class I SAM-dependent methyltransferase, partial [Niameybacter sp.]